MHWKTILVPHDFSSSSNHAAALARDEAKLHGGTIVLLHVIDLPRQIPSNAVIPTESGAQLSVKDYATQSAQAHLEDLSARLGKDGVSAATEIRFGNPVDEINRYVDENRVSLIVMGTHGHTGIRAMLAGSVTEKVVRTAKVPVLSVRLPD